MESAYTYSATQARALATSLLQSADVERMLSASTNEEIVGALRESYLAPYVQDATGTDWQIDAVLLQQQAAAFRLMLAIAPEPDILRGYVARYDFHNLRVMVKARVADLDYEETLTQLSPLGWYTPEDIYSHTVAETLYRLAPEFQDSYQQAYWFVEASEGDRAERELDAAYWTYRKRVVTEVTDPFMQHVLQVEIDLYNANNRLRAEIVDRLDFSKVYQSGGSLPMTAFNSVDTTQEILRSYGGTELWDAALEQYTQGDSVGLEQAARMYVQSMVRYASYDVFCSASLLDYLIATQTSADVVRTIVLGKQNGQNDDMIRAQVSGLLSSLL